MRFPVNTNTALNTAMPKSSGTSPDRPAVVSALPIPEYGFCQGDTAKKLTESCKLYGDRRKGDIPDTMAQYQLSGVLPPGLCKEDKPAVHDLDQLLPGI